MTAELLMQGADAYTSLAEVTAATEIDTPEATPVIFSFTLGLSYGATIVVNC
ncbi:LxmA leader domain family RiPP [Streptosporangium sp. NPDC002607]